MITYYTKKGKSHCENLFQVPWNKLHRVGGAAFIEDGIELTKDIITISWHQYFLFGIGVTEFTHFYYENMSEEERFVWQLTNL